MYIRQSKNKTRIGLKLIWMGIDQMGTDLGWKLSTFELIGLEITQDEN